MTFWLLDENLGLPLQMHISMEKDIFVRMQVGYLTYLEKPAPRTGAFLDVKHISVGGAS